MSDEPRINIEDLDYEGFGNDGYFQARRAEVARSIGGGRRLGYGVVVVPPGKAAWPYHSHRVNEEMFFILEGEGTLRHGGREYPLRAGDFVASPPGPDLAHQIANTSDADLKYLCVSTMESPEICHYPDSDKFGMYDRQPGARDDWLRHLGRLRDGLDYYDGEDT